MRDAPDAATYERLSAVLSPAQDELIRALAPREGERWLELGSGAVGVRAARTGADVTVADRSAPLLEKARGNAEEEGLPVRFDVTGPEYLPYDDASFDVLASSFGFIYAGDHAAVAGELARVARPGARLGFTSWKPNPKVAELYRRFTDEPLEGRESAEWGREEHVENMLGDDFELDFHDGTLWLDAESGEELWDIFSSASRPVIALLSRLDPEHADAFHRAFVELYETYRAGHSIHAPRRYLLTTGTRR